MTNLVSAERDIARKERMAFDNNRVEWLTMQTEIKKQKKFKNVVTRVRSINNDIYIYIYVYIFHFLSWLILSLYIIFNELISHC